MLETGIETQVDFYANRKDQPHSHEKTYGKRRDLNAYVSLLFCFHIYA